MRALVLLLVALMWGGPVSGDVLRKYDPLRVSSNVGVEMRDVEMVDSKRGREIPLRVYFDVKREKALPVILFSHGLGGSRENNAYVCEHWASRGFVVVAMQHVGSDSAVWKGEKRAKRFAALKKAANLENSLARFADVGAVLDQLEAWQGEGGHFLKGRMDLSKVGMSGHSYGAVTTQAVSGQWFGYRGAEFADKRIDAALMMSPSVPAVGTPKIAFQNVKIPWMLMTGTKDSSPIGRTTVEDRRKVYPALPARGMYELVLKDAEHMAFSDRTLLGRKHRNPNHHKVIIATSTAFWEETLKGDVGAKRWLRVGGAKKLLEDGDVWQWK